MSFRRSLVLLVASTLLPLLLFSAVAVRQYGREQNTAGERALLDAARTLVVAMDKHFEATVVGLRVLGSSAVSGWMASITLPVERGVFRRPVLAILAVGAALSLIGVTAAVVMGRRISRPIEALSD